MVRRRSCLIDFSVEPDELKRFNKFIRRKIFRRSVKYKKFRFKGTKFKRRQIRKLKHKALWAVQFNVLADWTLAVRVAKQYVRYQYHYRFFVNNSIITHRTTWSARRNRLFLTQGQWVSASITRRLFLAAGKTNNDDVLKSQKHDHHALAFYPAEVMIGDMSTTPFLSMFDKQMFVHNWDADIGALDIFLKDFILDDVMFLQFTEIYKILTALWFTKLINVSHIVYQI